MKRRESIASRVFLADQQVSRRVCAAWPGLLGAVALTGLVACGGNTASVKTASVKESEPVKPTSTLKTGGGARTTEAASTVAVPQAYQSVRSLLLARDTQDLPDKATLQKHSNAVEALTWLGTHDDQLIVRARALACLGYFESPQVRTTLLELARDARQPAKARAGAVEGLARLNPASDASVRGALLELVKDPEIRVGVAAVDALSAVPSARKDLEALARESGLSKDVQRALEAALK